VYIVRQRAVSIFSSPGMLFVKSERKSGFYRQMLNVLKIYKYIYCQLHFDCIVLRYLSGRDLVPAFLLFCNKEPKPELP
jgi:hypothetical protein